MSSDTGSTQSAASAMRQSKTKRHTAMMQVEIIEPKNSGIQCEKACSSFVQSAMMVVVRSERSRLPKKESGSFRSFSASAMRRTELSL